MANKSEILKNTGREMIYFKIIAILLPVFFLVVLELLLRIFSYGSDVHLIVQHKSLKDYYIVNPSVSKKYFSRFQATSGTNDIFLKKKPENGFRIFFMGSSTIVGFPYDKNLMASRILQQRLQDAYPNKTIEVINTAFTAINSITQKDFIDQILDYQPDAILFYAGHNEFYGAYGIGSNESSGLSPLLKTVHFKLMNFRTYQLLRYSIIYILNILTKNSNGSDQKGTLMKRIVKDQDIAYKSEKYNFGINQFRNNLSYILKKANNKKVPVFLSDLVSNVKDLPPFGNIDKENPSASEKFKEALVALSTGDTINARTYFYEAKDLDPVRFRAPEDINQVVYDLAKQPGVIFIPAKEWFSNASKGGLIGNNLIMEHVHPNIEGQFVLADAFYTKIIESGLIDMTPNPFTTRSKQYYRQNWAYTSLDSLIGVYTINQVKSYWPFTSLDNKISFSDTFKAQGIVDSLAFLFLKKPGIEFTTLHNSLGKFYESKSQYYLAYKEYESITKIYPYNALYYNMVANCLLILNDLYAAEKFLKQSIKINGTFYSYSNLAEIEFIKNNYREAIIDYNIAFKLIKDIEKSTNDKVSLLNKLYKSYLLINDDGNAQKISNILYASGYKVDKSSPRPEFNYSRYVPWNIEKIFNKAQINFNTNIDSAFYYLSLCQEINDCPLVNFYMGNILFQKKDIRALFYYNKAYDGYKNNPGFLARFCFANIVKQNKSKASEVLNELIVLDPKYVEIPRLKAFLQQ